VTDDACLSGVFHAGHTRSNGRKGSPPGQVAASAGAGQHIAESLSGKERIELNDLHCLPLTGQPTSE
jgi:hypothetical protein